MDGREIPREPHGFSGSGFANVKANAKPTRRQTHPRPLSKPLGSLGSRPGHGQEAGRLRGPSGRKGRHGPAQEPAAGGRAGLQASQSLCPSIRESEILTGHAGVPCPHGEGAGSLGGSVWGGEEVTPPQKSKGRLGRRELWWPKSSKCPWRILRQKSALSEVFPAPTQRSPPHPSIFSISTPVVFFLTQGTIA